MTKEEALAAIQKHSADTKYIPMPTRMEDMRVFISQFDALTQIEKDNQLQAFVQKEVHGKS